MHQRLRKVVTMLFPNIRGKVNVTSLRCICHKRWTKPFLPLFLIAQWLNISSGVAAEDNSLVDVVLCSGQITEDAFRGDPQANDILYSIRSEFRATVAADGRYLLVINEEDGRERHFAFDGLDT